MSNYNTTLQSNNNLIQSLIEKANSLPEASEGGIDTSDATASAEEIFKDETAYVNGEKVTGTFTIDSELTTQNNLITQIQTALEGKASASLTLQDKTITPTASVQTITADSDYDGLGVVTVTGDANLVTDNIKSGVSIFGVAGSYEGSGSTSIEALTGKITADVPMLLDGTVYYTDSNLNYQTKIFQGEECNVTIAKGTIVFVQNAAGTPEASTGVLQIGGDRGQIAFYPMQNNFVITC